MCFCLAQIILSFTECINTWQFISRIKIFAFFKNRIAHPPNQSEIAGIIAARRTVTYLPYPTINSYLPSPPPPKEFDTFI
jgi:hypothetical protein